MTTLSLRARLSFALVASLIAGGVALAVGAHHLEALHQQRLTVSDRAFSRAVWATLALVALAANVGGLLVVVLTTRTLSSRILRVRDAVLALAHSHELRDTQTQLQLITGASTEDEFIPLHNAVVEARAQLKAALTRVRMEADRNRAIVDTVFASVFAVDGGGRILSANPAAATMFGRPLSGLVGAVLSDLLATDSLHMTVDDLGTVSFAGSETERRFTTRVRLYGQSAFPAEVAVTPLALDGQRAWAVFVYDLTARYQADAALVEARLAAEVANRAKSAFLARMSHELRTPLNSMIGFTKIVRRSKSSDLSERDRHYLDRVQVSSEHLLVLVSDILDLSHIESGKIDLQPTTTDVSQIVTAIVEQFEPQVADRPVVLEAKLPDVPAIVTIDATRLRQVITNLVGNAIKFTARGEITVSVQLNHETGLASAITVHDTGIGIPLERQSHIFESFEQGDLETSVRYGGTGLGLALSWRIAQQMGCMLSVESMPGAGSTFTLAFGQAVSQGATLTTLSNNDAA